jgi:hypothetical protein
MKETTALIERVTRLSATHQQLTLSVEPSVLEIKAGQCLLAGPAGVPHEAAWSPYLREAWFPTGIAAGRGTRSLLVERPARETYQPGQPVSVIGPVGRALRMKKPRNVLFVGLETEPTPLLFALPDLLLLRASVTLLLLGAAARYATDHLPAEIEIITGDADYNWHNRITTIGWADQIFAVGRIDDDGGERFRRWWELLRTLRADIPDQFAYAYVLQPLPCGTGACQACMVRTRSGVVTTCTDGACLDLKAWLG